MRYERAYARRQRAITFAGSTRTITIPLDIADFERLEELAKTHNLGNARPPNHSQISQAEGRNEAGRPELVCPSRLHRNEKPRPEETGAKLADEYR